jgi:tRNA (cmo5U34)-methyltransferase
VFDERVVNVFDDMVARSIPFYAEQQRLFKVIVSRFAKGNRIIDLGCSTGTTLLNLAGETDSELIGYDNSEAMLEQARRNAEQHGLAHRISFEHCDLNGDLGELDLQNSDVVLMCWTLQFVRPLHRDALIRKIYRHLNNGGALIVTDRVLTNDSSMNRYFLDFYYDHKRSNGYSDQEIISKREALENVLIPYRVDENMELFSRNGFEISETFFQWFNFAGFLCIKNQVPP